MLVFVDNMAKIILNILFCVISSQPDLLRVIVMTFLVRECYGSPKISIKFVKIRQNSLKFTPKNVMTRC
jgi:hypothetical protein